MKLIRQCSKDKNFLNINFPPFDESKHVLDYLISDNFLK